MIAKQLLNPVTVKICDLHADPANARKHGTKNLDAIKASLHKFGQRKPIIVQREGMIVRAGNGTMEAAKALGWTELAAVIFDEDNATASQYAIADNRSAELAEWDDETLASLLDGMDEQSKDLLGFDQQDIDELLKSITPVGGRRRGARAARRSDHEDRRRVDSRRASATLRRLDEG